MRPIEVKNNVLNTVAASVPSVSNPSAAPVNYALSDEIDQDTTANGRIGNQISNKHLIVKLSFNSNTASIVTRRVRILIAQYYGGFTSNSSSLPFGYNSSSAITAYNDFIDTSSMFFLYDRIISLAPYASGIINKDIMIKINWNSKKRQHLRGSVYGSGNQTSCNKNDLHMFLISDLPTLATDYPVVAFQLIHSYTD